MTERVVEQLEKSLQGTHARPDPWPLCPTCKHVVSPLTMKSIQLHQRAERAWEDSAADHAQLSSRWGHFFAGWLTSFVMFAIALLGRGCA